MHVFCLIGLIRFDLICESLSWETKPLDKNTSIIKPYRRIADIFSALPNFVKALQNFVYRMNFEMSVLDEFLEAFFQKLKKSSLSNFMIELHEFDFFLIEKNYMHIYDF